MEEQIIDIVEITGFTEVTDTKMTFKALEVEEDAFEDIIQTLEEEFDINISPRDAAKLYAGTVDSMIKYVSTKTK